MGKKKELLEGQYYVGVVPITVEARNGQEFQKKLVVDGPVKPFAFKVPEKPKAVVLNKKGEVLAHDVIVKRQG